MRRHHDGQLYNRFKSDGKGKAIYCVHIGDVEAPHAAVQDVVDDVEEEDAKSESGKDDVRIDIAVMRTDSRRKKMLGIRLYSFVS